MYLVYKIEEMYKHIREKERIEIYKYISMWYKPWKIWKILWRHRTTISRHIEENSYKGKYDPVYAWEMYKNRRIRCWEKRKKIVNDIRLREEVIRYLKDKEVDYSPDVIAYKINEKRWKKVISMKSIYNHIRNREKSLGIYLRYKWWWYKKRDRKKELLRMRHIPLIELRPIEIEKRERIWDWEVDCIVSKEHKPWLITIVDRKSRYLIIQKKHTFKAKPVSELITYALYWKCVHSITSDNGVEFQYLNRVWERLKCEYYRCHAYSSWEKGSNERNNREVRVYIPKWSDISKYTEKELLDIQNKINRKPRKILWYKTAEEVFFWEK